MKFPEDKTTSTMNRRGFAKTAGTASLLAPLMAAFPKPLLDPLFRGERRPKPQIETPEDAWNEGFGAVFDDLESNLQGKIAFIRSKWARPATRYLATYLYETCFTSRVWDLWMPDIAREIFQPFLNKQRDDGRIPNEVDPMQSSSNIHPPLVAWSIERLAIHEANVAFLKNAYPALVRFNRWLNKERFRKGLYFWGDYDETAMESSPRFYIGKGGSRIKRIESLDPVDLNAYVVIQLRSLSVLAGMLGKTSESKRFSNEADVLSTRINRRMWDQRDGIYYDVYQDKPVRIPTIASFFPLLAGVPDKKQAEQMIQVLTDRERFWTHMPFPSVATNDPHFKLDKWEGPAWLSASYLVIRGLEKYGRRDLAAIAARRIVSHVFNTWSKRGRFYEYYHPVTGEVKGLKRSGNFVKNMVMEGGPVRNYVGPTGLVNNLLVEDILGVRWEESKLVFKPALPVEWLGQTIRYKSPFLNLDLCLKLEDPQNVRVKITSPTQDEMLVPNLISSTD